MKKYILLFILAFMLSYSQNTYSQLKLSIQPGLQIPIGDFSNTASVGFGGIVTVEFLKTQKKGIDWSFTGTAGYYHFSAARDLPAGEDYSYADIPLQAGLRYYLGKSDFKAYVGAELGFHLLTISTTLDGIERDASDTYFGFAPIVGFKSYFTRSLEMDINLKLNSISSEESSLSYIGFNFGLQFALQK